MYCYVRQDKCLCTQVGCLSLDFGCVLAIGLKKSQGPGFTQQRISASDAQMQSHSGSAVYLFPHYWTSFANSTVFVSEPKSQNSWSWNSSCRTRQDRDARPRRDKMTELLSSFQSVSVFCCERLQIGPAELLFY